MWLQTGCTFSLICATAFGESPHQTQTFSPIGGDDVLPYRIAVRPYDFGDDDLPTLHSFASATYDGKWVLLAGRTNGLHGFDQNPFNNFPAASQNRDVWVIDPLAKQSWRRSLTDAASGLTEDEISSITPTNNQFYQMEDRLYMSGGYGLDTNGSFTTFDTLTAIDLPPIIDWVQDGSGTAADHIRQVQHPALRVTGGAMYPLQNRMHLIFGQDFPEGYTAFGDGIYTEQVRSFDIIDDGQALSIDNLRQTIPQAEYRRRDLNVVPVIRPQADGSLSQELVALSGVFTVAQGAWTVPVEIDARGQPNMVDPDTVGAFKQGMNNYHSARIGLYSAATGMMHQLLFGGISLQSMGESSGQILTDDNLPFVNDITSIVSDAEGNYAQYHLGGFPELYDSGGGRLRFGTNAEFFPAEGIERYDNGVLSLDALAEETVIGYIFGGIASNAPHTRGVEGAVSVGSNRIFEVVLTNVPEPNGGAMVIWILVLWRFSLTGIKIGPR